MFKILLINILLISGYVQSFGGEYVDGFIINNSNDTIFCEIKEVVNPFYAGEIRQNKVNVIIDQEKIRYEPSEILEYQYEKDGVVYDYKTIRQITKECDLEFSIADRLSNIFILQKVTGARVMLFEIYETTTVYDHNIKTIRTSNFSYEEETNTQRTKLIIHDLLIFKNSSRYYENPAFENYKDIFRFCPLLHDELKESGFVNRKSLPEMVIKYNAWYKETSDYDKMESDILTAEHKKEGIYESFNDFRANNPSIQNCSFETKSWYLITQENKKIKDYWGYCKNGKVYARIKYNGAFWETVAFNYGTRYSIIVIETPKKSFYYFIDINTGEQFPFSDLGFKKAFRFSICHQLSKLKDEKEQTAYIEALNTKLEKFIDRP